jgi:hypothetical protein
MEVGAGACRAVRRRAGQQGRGERGDDALARAVDDSEVAVSPLDEKILIAEVHGLAGRDDPAGARNPEGVQQGRPVAEVAPADIHRGHDHAIVLGGALHDGPVDRQRREMVVRHLERQVRPHGRAQQGEQGRITLERRADGPAAPEEHAGVPCRPRDAEQLPCSTLRRLLLEAAQRVDAQAVEVGARVEVREEVAEMGRRSGRRYAQRDQRLVDLESLLGKRCRRPEDLAEGGLVCDRMIGREDGHDLVLRAVDGSDGQGHRGRGVTTDRL